jgi:hypothetical protein
MESCVAIRSHTAVKLSESLPEWDTMRGALHRAGGQRTESPPLRDESRASGTIGQFQGSQSEQVPEATRVHGCQKQDSMRC